MAKERSEGFDAKAYAMDSGKPYGAADVGRVPGGEVRTGASAMLDYVYDGLVRAGIIAPGTKEAAARKKVSLQEVIRRASSKLGADESLSQIAQVIQEDAAIWDKDPAVQSTLDDLLDEMASGHNGAGPVDVGVSVKPDSKKTETGAPEQPKRSVRPGAPERLNRMKLEQERAAAAQKPKPETPPNAAGRKEDVRAPLPEKPEGSPDYPLAKRGDVDPNMQTKPPKRPGILSSLLAGEKARLGQAAREVGSGTLGGLLKGAGRFGLNTATGGVLSSMLLGAGLPYVAETVSEAENRKLLAEQVNLGDTLNQMRLQQMESRNALQTLTANPALMQKLQKQLREKEIGRTGLLPTETRIGGRLGSGPFQDPEGLVELLSASM